MDEVITLPDRSGDWKDRETELYSRQEVSLAGRIDYDRRLLVRFHSGPLAGEHRWIRPADLMPEGVALLSTEPKKSPGLFIVGDAVRVPVDDDLELVISAADAYIQISVIHGALNGIVWIAVPEGAFATPVPEIIDVEPAAID